MIHLRTPEDLISRSAASAFSRLGSFSQPTMKNRVQICTLLLMVAAVAAQTGTRDPLERCCFWSKSSAAPVGCFQEPRFNLFRCPGWSRAADQDALLLPATIVSAQI